MSEEANQVLASSFIRQLEQKMKDNIENPAVYQQNEIVEQQ